MKLLFVHDVKAEEFNGDIFARSYGYDIWKERYLTSFSEIKVCFRLKQSNTDLNGKTDKSSGPNVYFEKRIGNFKGPDVFFNNKIKNVLRENIDDCDAVIVRLDSFMGLQTIRECKKKNRMYMIELVGCAWDSFWNHGIFGKILAPYLFLRTRYEVKHAPFVVYVTSEFLQRRYPTNGLNTNISNVKIFLKDDFVLEKRLQKIRLGKKRIVVGTAANVDVRYKGQQFVIEAIGILKKKGIDNIEYQILGAGDSTFLKKIAKNNDVESQIKFIGSVPHEYVFDWMQNDLDIYIQPSLQEGLPRSVIEAMSVGLPCIGSDVAGIPELIDSKYIFKRKGNKSKEISDLILKMNTGDMLEQASVNFKHSSEFDYNLLIDKRIAILDKFKSQILLKNID